MTVSKFCFLAIFIAKTSSSSPQPRVQKLLTFVSWWEAPGAGGGWSSCRVFTPLAQGCSVKLVLPPRRDPVARAVQPGSSVLPTALPAALAPGPGCSSDGCAASRRVAVPGGHASVTSSPLFFLIREELLWNIASDQQLVERIIPKWELFAGKVNNYIPVKSICISFEI